MSQTPFRQLHLPPGRPGGFSVAFAPRGVLFTGIQDGLILRYRPSAGWTTFAYISPTRVDATCDNTTDPNLWLVCGFPAGLAYDGLTGQLYVGGGYEGLMTVGPNPGMLARPLAISADGSPLNGTIGVDFNPLNRNIYFTDTGTNYNISVWRLGLRANDTSGRLMQYNTNTRRVTVLMRGLGFPSGVAVSADGSFFIVSETSLNRTTRFWLTGPKANTSEPFITDIVWPVGIRRTALGEFLITANTVDLASGTLVPITVSADTTGRIIEKTSLSEQYGNLFITGVHQRSLNETYISTPFASYIGLYEGPI
ncbi:Protein STRICTOSIDINE SYNTHASE-LIKE 12 [Linum grandiflorum]